jgi:LmbE family N-acetylglucosaminyl deacetylase
MGYKKYNMTSPELAIIRHGEQLAAASVLGVSNVTFLNQEDGRLEGVDPIELNHNITQWIRIYQPDLVISFSPETDYSQYLYGLMHRDHQTTGKSTLDSVYPSCRDYLDFPDLFEAGIMPWIVPEMWMFAFGPVGNSDVIVNITGTPFTAKYTAMLEHKSQYTDPAAVESWLMSIGSSVAAKNGLNPSELVEAYQVVTIL